VWKYIPEENDLVRYKHTEGENDNEPYLLIPSFIGTIAHGSDIWLIDSDDSKHMT